MIRRRDFLVGTTAVAAAALVRPKLSAAAQTDAAKKWMGLAEKVWASINQQFWYEEGGYLYDVVNGQERDTTLRPNQILAVSLPFDSVTPDRASRIVAIVEEKLLTPFGLRTLDPRDKRYAPRYHGDARSRDTAYHQGTVWPWLIGAFVDAWVWIHKRTPAAIHEARRQYLQPLLDHLEEVGLGHISEIANAEAPHAPRGCPWQAWSVGEALRLDRVVLPEPAKPAPLAKPARRRTPVFALATV